MTIIDLAQAIAAENDDHYPFHGAIEEAELLVCVEPTRFRKGLQQRLYHYP